jgi:hypothetical protein
MKIKNTVVAIISTALLYSTFSYAAIADVTNQPIEIVSGGIGDDEMADIVAKQEQYNLKLIFTEPSGQYLADVHVVITDNKGTIITEQDSVGPILLVKLKSGNYKIKSSTEGENVMRKVTVRNGKLSTYNIYLKEFES